jgi:hypothetical protein
MHYDHTFESNSEKWRNMHSTPRTSHQSLSGVVVSLVKVRRSSWIEVFCIDVAERSNGYTWSARAVADD